MKNDTLTSADGTSLTSYTWEPDGEVKGDVVLAHGVGEHLGRYEHVGAHLAAAGYRVRGVDFRGHGKSAGKRGHVVRWEDYVDDLRAIIATVGGPHAILAHSMGTVVTLDHLRDATAWAYVGTAVTVDFGVDAPAWKIAAGKLLSRLWPGLSMGNEIPASDICSDEQVVRDYLADPLVFATITPRWFTEFTGAQARIRAAAAHYDTPALVPYGVDDKIISIPALKTFAGQYGAPFTLVPYAHMRHEVLNEPDRSAVLDKITGFLDEHVTDAAA